MKTENKIIRTLKDYPLAVFCGIVILVGSAAIFLRGGSASELSTKEGSLDVRIRRMDQNAKNAKNLKADLAELKDLVAAIEARLFNRNQRAVNISFFYALEEQLEVHIASIGQVFSEDPIYAKGGARELNQYSAVRYNISLLGQFDAILAFLYELKRVDPLIRVANLQLVEGSNRDHKQGMLEARLKLDVLSENN